MPFVLATLAAQVSAQTGPPRAQIPATPLETGSLSAAMEELRWSPFHATESAVPVGSGLSRDLWVPMAIHSLGQSIQTASNDSTFPTRRVFLASLGAAQTGPPRAQSPTAQLEIGSLSAAMEEVRRSPFYSTESSAYLGSGVSRALWVPTAHQSPGWSIQTASKDSTFSDGRVFFTALGAAVLSDVVGFYVALSSSGGSGISLLPVTAIPILGTAAGAKVAGARFRPALAGSAAGFGVVLISLALGAHMDPDDSFVLFIAIPAVIQAGITTLIASGFN